MSKKPGPIRVLRRISRSRPVASVTALGWSLLIGIVVTGIPGWWLGWLEFRALCVMCVVVMFVAVLSVLGKQEHEVLFELQRPGGMCRSVRLRAGRPVLQLSSFR